MIPSGILSSCKIGQSSSNCRKPRTRKVEKSEILRINSFVLKIPLAAILFRTFVITMFPSGILSTYKVTQSSSKDLKPRF